MAYRNLPEMPCGPILELHGQRKRFHVPYGLKKLLEEMTREVLRTQPENIYDFLARHMEAKNQKKRDEDDKRKSRKSWQVHRWSTERKSVLSPDELKEFMASIGAPEKDVEKSAIAIQSAFRGYQARQKVKALRKSVTEDGIRKSLAESQMRKSADETVDGSKRPSLVETLTPDNATDVEQHSAVIIQSAFRGMQARKMVKERRSIVAAENVRRSLIEAEVKKTAEAEEAARRQEEEKRVSEPREASPGPETKGEEGPSPTPTADGGDGPAPIEAEPEEAAPVEESQDEVPATEPTAEQAPAALI